MFPIVVAKNRCGFLQSHRCGDLRRGLLVLTAIAALSGSAGIALGQDEKFSARVVDESASTQRLIVPLHRSVTVETTAEITRADIMARDIADVQVVSPTRVLITGKRFGTTALILMGSDNKQYQFEISVELDLRELTEALSAIDPLSTARATSILGNIVLTGTVSSTQRAERMTELARLFLPTKEEGGRETTVQNHLELAGEQQVLLRVVVAEVSRTAARELSVNGFLAGENFRDGFIVNQLGGINPINIGAAGAAQVTRDLPFFTDPDGIIVSDQTTFSLGFPRVQAQLFVRAMADNSLLRVLAEPNLVTLSGETATFLAGGEFPIPVPQGNQTVTIEFREFGVRLSFTPIVRGGQRIRMRVTPEVSELDFTTAVQFQGFVIPGLTTRSASTTVELGSGQT
ncbi:MAG: pilus assembly protein N-terminal domain-containing protein, partial [Planctomycetes bacterium]|nr:pilus assembly protein N-terminal domain-containing protein [Planctomycetota bacterium]